MDNKAAFSLSKYYFSQININLENKLSNDLKIDFEPSGIFYVEESKYELHFVFKAYVENIKNTFITIKCISVFKFENIHTLQEIPSYFYRNSIAIVFPYIRAYISTVTLQANVPPIVLPTMNLSYLEEPLKKNTILNNLQVEN